MIDLPWSQMSSAIAGGLVGRLAKLSCAWISGTTISVSRIPVEKE